MLLRHYFRVPAERIEPTLRRSGNLLLVVLLALALINIWHEVIGAGIKVAATVALVTLLALALGHLLGGPDQTTRTATAISCAARNPGLALLIVTLNGAPPLVTRAVLAYFVVAAITATPCALWRQRSRTSQHRAA